MFEIIVLLSLGVFLCFMAAFFLAYEPIFEKHLWRVQGWLLDYLILNPHLLDTPPEDCSRGYRWDFSVNGNNYHLWYWTADKAFSFHGEMDCHISGFRTPGFGGRRWRAINKLVQSKVKALDVVNE